MQDTPNLAADEGLLFTWPDDRERTFHMADVAYPIDIAFLSPAGHVRRLVEAARPGVKTRWSSRARYVLETNAGVLSSEARVGTRFALTAQADDPEIVDALAFMKGLVTGLVETARTNARTVPWQPDRLNNGKTESALIDRKVLTSWLASYMNPADLRTTLETAMSEAGLDLLGDALVVGGVANLARRSPYGLVLTRVLA